MLSQKQKMGVPAPRRAMGYDRRGIRNAGDVDQNPVAVEIAIANRAQVREIDTARAVAGAMNEEEMPAIRKEHRVDCTVTVFADLGAGTTRRSSAPNRCGGVIENC